MYPQPLYSLLAQLVEARANCLKSGRDRHTDKIQRLARDHMPSGAGVDNGTTIDLDKSTPERLVFYTSFHHMHESGCYDGWTEHTITVRPSLGHRFHLAISGRNRNEIKNYLADLFRSALSEVIENAKEGAATLDDVTEADEAATSKYTALANLRDQVVKKETPAIVDMYERAAWAAGATIDETETCIRAARKGLGWIP